MSAVTDQNQNVNVNLSQCKLANNVYNKQYTEQDKILYSDPKLLYLEDPESFWEMNQSLDLNCYPWSGYPKFQFNPEGPLDSSAQVDNVLSLLSNEILQPSDSRENSFDITDNSNNPKLFLNQQQIIEEKSESPDEYWRNYATPMYIQTPLYEQDKGYVIQIQDQSVFSDRAGIPQQPGNGVTSPVNLEMGYALQQGMMEVPNIPNFMRYNQLNIKSEKTPTEMILPNTEDSRGEKKNIFNSPKPNCEQRSETKKKCYPCIICGKVFNRSYNQQQHVLIVHAAVRKKGFKCSYEGCTKSYYRSADLQRHKRIHFQVSLNLSCIACKKSFNRSDQLQKHVACCRHAILSPTGTINSSTNSNISHQAFQQAQAIDYYSPDQRQSPAYLMKEG